MRRAIQTFVFIVFVLSFIRTGFPLKTFFSAGVFSRFSPLVGGITSITGRAFILPLLASVILLILTLVLGRYFCGWICPLGTVFDAASRILSTRKRTRRLKPGWRRIKYLLLTLIVVAGIFSLNLAGFFDPLVALTRFFALLVYPFVLLVGNGGARLAAFLAEKFEADFPFSFYVKPVYFSGSGLLLVFLVILLELNVIERRFFCRNLCPLGALLGLISRFSIFKRKVGDGCTDCGRCRLVCSSAAIDGDDPRITFPAECIQCRECARVCPVKTVSFIPSIRIETTTPYLPERRQFLLAGAAALAAVSLFRIESVFGFRDRRFIRPPGTLPEDVFLSRCLRCGLCVKSCPTGVIQPVNAKRGINNFWTPEMVMKKGACDYNCNVCGQVCPTGAIRPLPMVEKIHAKIGTAEVNKERCIAWSEEKICLVCVEVCPYRAISPVSRGNHGVPVMVPERCAGCGMCENHCPAGKNGNGGSKKDAAIRVFREGERRYSRGSYRNGSKISLGADKVSLPPEDLPAGFVP